MANKYYTGLAPLVAQVDTFTPGGTIEIGDIFTLTITGLDGSTESISYAAAAATAADVAAGLVAAWEAATGTLMSAITASGTVTVILTANVAGTAFSVAATTTEANGAAADAQTFSRAATTANSGPKDMSIVTNWDADTLPGGAAGQVVWIVDAVILYGLDALKSVANAIKLHTLRTQIGSNPAAGTGVIYAEIKASEVHIGLLTDAGSSTEPVPINIDTAATACQFYIYNAGSNGTMPSIRLKSSSASSNVYGRHTKGRVGLAHELGESATFGQISNDEAGYIYAGKELTLTTVKASGGNVIVECAFTNLLQSGGKVTSYGSGAIPNVDVTEGTFESNSTGLVGALNVSGTGIADFTKSKEARTITTPKVGGGGGKIKINSAITLTNPIALIDDIGNIEVSAA